MYEYNRLQRVITVVGILLLFVYTVSIDAATMRSAEGNKKVKVFYTKNDNIGWDVLIKGRILSIGAREDAHQQELSHVAHDKTKVTVRLYNDEGIVKGSNLYVVDNKNLVVSRLTVQSVYQSNSFGSLCTGYGFFRLATEGNRVVQKIEDENARYAYIHKARGDYYYRTGEPGKAIREYKTAIELDHDNPEAHLSLAQLYMEDNLLQYAANEFGKAYENIKFMVDNHEKYILLSSFARLRYKQVYNYELPSDLRKKYIEEGITYSSMALEYKPDSVEVLYMLSVFNYKNPDPSDVKAKEYLMKVVKLDSKHADAYTALAELYYRHKNNEKAAMYAEKALKIDPSSERARFIYKISQ
ncbi:MAG: tetratricopeptide repeat protein [Spirochaetota bacterium]